MPSDTPHNQFRQVLFFKKYWLPIERVRSIQIIMQQAILDHDPTEEELEIRARHRRRYWGNETPEDLRWYRKRDLKQQEEAAEYLRNRANNLQRELLVLVMVEHGIEEEMKYKQSMMTIMTHFLLQAEIESAGDNLDLN